jgi:pimeloyl-ACP methyl ester carboxylesterase
MEAVIERSLRVGELTFNLAECGEGPPVLFLHGFPDSWHLWRQQMSAVAQAGYRAIAPDLRGFGNSDRPGAVEEYSLPLLLGDVTGVLDELGLDRVSVISHDWGAVLAWAFASLVPDRVEKLVAVSMGHPEAFPAAGIKQKQLSWYTLWFQFPGVAEMALPEDDWAFFLEWSWGGITRGSDVDAERQIADLSRPGALTAGLKWYRANVSPDSFHRTKTPFDHPPVWCPTMGVWGTGDPSLSEAQMRGSEQFVAGPWRYERMEGADHWVPVHASGELNRLILDFLAHPSSREPARVTSVVKVAGADAYRRLARESPTPTDGSGSDGGG